MRQAGQLVAECLDMLTDEVKSGVTTERLAGWCSSKPWTQGDDAP